MKKLNASCVVMCMILVSTCTLLASIVNAPPEAPSWWNSEDATYYAYGDWSADIIGGSSNVSPPDDSSHWASNFLSNSDFIAVIGLENETISIDLDNVYRTDLYKKIYVSITGTTVSTVDNVDTVLDTDGGVFTGTQNWSINENGEWTYVLEGEIHPQPDYVRLTFTVPGMTDVTNIWAGEVCVPEPATISMLCLGALGLFRRKK